MEEKREMEKLDWGSYVEIKRRDPQNQRGDGVNQSKPSPLKSWDFYERMSCSETISYIRCSGEGS